MKLNKVNKLIDVYKNRGFLSVLSAIASKILKKCSEKYRYKKEEKIIKNITNNKTEIILEINNYKMVLNGKKRGIHSDLIINRIREPLASAEMKNSLKKGDVLLEAGANIGYYTIMESKIVGENGLIYAVEPASDNFNYLIRNIKENKLENVLPYNLALGSKNGEAILKIYEFENLNTIEDISYAPQKAQEKVIVKSIDSFLSDKKRPTFIRMDVEGYELEIFKGMQSLLKNYPPRAIFLEIHFYIMGKKKSLMLLNLLKESGYEVKRYFLDKKFSPRIYLLDYLLERLDKIKDKLHIFYGEVKNVTIDDLIANKNHLGSGSPEIFFELRKNL